MKEKLSESQKVIEPTVAKEIINIFTLEVK